MTDDQASTSPGWLTLAEASALLGVSVDSLRHQIKRGAIEVQRGNNRDRLVRVLVTSQMVASQGLAQATTGPTEASDELAVEIGRLVRELELARQALAEARDEIEGARELSHQREIELVKLQERLNLASERIADKNEQIQELKDALVWANRPWWQKLFIAKL